MGARGGHPRSRRVLVHERCVGELADIEPHDRSVRGTVAGDVPHRPRPYPRPRASGYFAEVGGWIAYGNDQGIWAVNPTPGGTPADRIHLSERPGEPVAWSSDGSKLLISGEVSDATRNPLDDRDLFVLNADGTETRLTKNPASETSGSISPDGSQVVYGV